MRSYTVKPQWVRDLAKSSPCVVYTENSTRIVSGEHQQVIVGGKVRKQFVAVTQVLPASVACDPATLPGSAPHSRSSRVLHGAGSEGFCPGEVEPASLPVPYPLLRNSEARSKALTLPEQVLTVLQGLRA